MNKKQIAINPSLKKFQITQFIRQIPRMFKKLTVGSDDDITFICDTTVEPERVLTEFIKMLAKKEEGHKKDENDWTSTPFQIMEVPTCRRIMLKFADKDLSKTEWDKVVADRKEHMKNCNKCLTKLFGKILKIFGHFQKF